MRQSLIALFFYTATAVALTAPLSLHPASQAANEGDPLHVSWILAWDIHQLIRDPFHLFDSNAFYPYRKSLAFSEHLIVQGVLAGPIYLLSGNALLAQNLLVILTLVFSALAMFLLVREVLGREDAALVAGLLYAFHTYSFHEIPRLQLLSTQWWPLALLFLHRSVQSGGWKNRFLFGLFFLLQGLSCTYYLLYFSMALLWWVPGFFFLSKRRDALRGLAGLGIPLLAAAVIIGGIALPYLLPLKSFGYQRTLAEGLDLLAYVKPPEGNVLSRWASFTVKPSIVPQFLGFFALGLALVGLARLMWRRESPPARAFLWLSLTTGLAGMFLSLGPTIHVAGKPIGTGAYGLLYQYFPPFRVLRSPERISVLVHFALAVLGGYGAAGLFERLARSSAPAFSWVRMVILVLLSLEHFSGGQPAVRIPAGKEVPPVYPWLAGMPGREPVVELPLYPRQQLRLFALYMFYSTYHWKPILFGRTSFYPPLMEYLAWELRDFPDRDSLGLLRWLGVKTIVVHPRIWPPAERGRKLGLLNSMPELRPVARFPSLSGSHHERLGLGEERVYILADADTPRWRETLCMPRDEIPPQSWKIKGSGSVPPQWAVDREPATKWKTEGQLPGDHLLLDLGRPERVSAIRLPFSHPHHEFPRHLVVKGRVEGGRWETLPYRNDLAAKLEVTQSLIENPGQSALILRFTPREVRFLRLLVGGSRFDYALPDWSLPEIFIYRACEP